MAEASEDVPYRLAQPRAAKPVSKSKYQLRHGLADFHLLVGSCRLGGIGYNFMYLRAILCTFQISVDFYYVPVGGRGGGRGSAGEGGGGLERGGLEKGGARERGYNVYCMGTVSMLTVLAGTVYKF